jgi:asparagine synthase (glutamine-hydrolysing)
MFRYLALIWDCTDSSQSQLAAQLAARIECGSTPWQSVFQRSGMRLFCSDMRDDSIRCRSLGSSGVVLGTLFERKADLLDDSPSRQAELDLRAREQIVATRGRCLISQYWGNYVAFVVDPTTGRTLVIKDPTGSLPCFHTTHSGVTVVFSCFADCMGLDLPFTINWSYIEWRLAAGGLDVLQPAIKQVGTVQRGECLEFDPRGINRVAERQFYWNPLTFTDPAKCIEDSASARVALRSMVRHCVYTWANAFDHLLVRLSGGLDSSIVLACLANTATRPRVTCYTHYDPRGNSDERRWARIAAAPTKFEHIECSFDPKVVRLHSMTRLVPGVEPPSGIAYDERASIERRLSAAHGCDAVFSGEGGDSDFGSEAIGLAVEDYLRRHRLGTSMLRIAVDVAIRRDLSVWHVIGRAVRRHLFGFRFSEYQGEILKGSRLVAPHIRGLPLTRHGYPHPWFEGVREAPWITIFKLGSLTQTPEFYDPYLDPAEATPALVAPLYSQPLVELCLRIPVDVHFLGGRDRGLVRSAFAREVPAGILRRQWKDRAPGYLDELVRSNRTFFREMLLDGILVKKGLLVRKALEGVLAGDLRKDTFELGELFNHLDVEVWLRSMHRDGCRRMAA